MSGELTCLLTRHILLSLLSRCGSAPASINTCNSHSLLGPGSPLPPDKAPKFAGESRGPEFNARDPSRNQLASRKQPKPVGAVERHNDSNEDLRNLLPSGARQAVVRPKTATPANRPSTEQRNKADKFDLPSWAVDGVKPQFDAPDEVNSKQTNKASEYVHF